MHCEIIVPLDGRSVLVAGDTPIPTAVFAILVSGQTSRRARSTARSLAGARTGPLRGEKSGRDRVSLGRTLGISARDRPPRAIAKKAARPVAGTRQPGLSWASPSPIGMGPESPRASSTGWCGDRSTGPSLARAVTWYCTSFGFWRDSPQVATGLSNDIPPTKTLIFAGEMPLFVHQSFGVEAFWRV